jgi:enamine deaminase RidA (YjgF/YER057c/UK114 family)/quinol monooxygenase YgiN
MNPDQKVAASRREMMKAALLAGAGGLALGRTSPASAQPSGESVMSAASGSRLRLFDPVGLPPSNGFSQVAEVQPGKLLYLSGQVPRNAAGELIGAGDFRAQLEQVFKNIGIALSGAGATFADVVKLNYYCVDTVEPAQQRAIVEVRDRFVNTQLPPASTFVFVSRLVRPDWLIEIEAVAVLPAPGVREVVVLAQLEVDAGQVQALVALTRRLVADTLKEDGCLHYAFAVDVTVPTRLQLSERWRDERALRAHLEGSTLRQFRLALRKFQVRTPWVRRYEVAQASDLVLPRLE